MKNMIEVPSEKDFHRTTSIELTRDENTGLHKVNYRKCNLAMRSITDFTSIEMEIEVLDEEKKSEYEKEIEDFRKLCSNLDTSLPIPPRPPIKKVKIIGTAVSYFSTLTRIIVDDFDDFEKEYFEYLKLSRLDLGMEKD